MEITKTADSVISTFKPLSTTTVSIKSQQAMDLITTVFSDKIYKNRPLAVVRELIANAVDEHVKYNIARNVEVYLPQPGNPIFSVRDFAKGLPHGLMEDVYAALGESTKRENNICTGGLGFGAKSPACLTDAWTVTSYHEGVARSYAIYKKDGRLNMDLLLEEPTTESGILVEVPLPKNMEIQEFNTQAFHYLCTLQLPVTVTNLYLNSEESTNKYVVRAGMFKQTLPKFNVSGEIISRLDFGFRTEVEDTVNGIKVKLKVSNSSCGIVDNYGKNPLSGLVASDCVQHSVIMGAAVYEYNLSDIFHSHDELVKLLDIISDSAELFITGRCMFELPIGSMDITSDRERVATTEKTRAALMAAWSVYLDRVIATGLETLQKMEDTGTAGRIPVNLWGSDGHKYLSSLLKIADMIEQGSESCPLVLLPKSGHKLSQLRAIAKEIDLAFNSVITVCRPGGSGCNTQACMINLQSAFAYTYWTRFIYLDEETLPQAVDQSDDRDLVKIRDIAEGRKRKEALSKTRINSKWEIKCIVQGRRKYLDKWFGAFISGKLNNLSYHSLDESHWLQRNKKGGWTLVRNLKDGSTYVTWKGATRSSSKQASTGVAGVRRAKGEIPANMTLRGALFSLHSWGAYLGTSAWGVNCRTNMAGTEIESYEAADLHKRIVPGWLRLNSDPVSRETLVYGTCEEYTTESLVDNLAIAYDTYVGSTVNTAAHMWVLLDKSHKSLLVLQNKDTYSLLKKIGCQEVDLRKCEPEIDMLRLRKMLSWQVNHPERVFSSMDGPAADYLKYVRYGLALSEDIKDEEYKVSSLLVGAIRGIGGDPETRLEDAIDAVLENKYKVDRTTMRTVKTELCAIWKRHGDAVEALYKTAFGKIKERNPDSTTTMMAKHLLDVYWNNSSSTRNDGQSLVMAGRKHSEKHHMLRPVRIILHGNVTSRDTMDRLDGLMSCLPYYDEEKEIIRPARKLAAAAIKEEKELFARFCKANKLK